MNKIPIVIADLALLIFKQARIAYMFKVWNVGYQKTSPRARAEAQFTQTQKHKQTLSEIEQAKRADREKSARLKALRLAKAAKATHLVNRS